MGRMSSKLACKGLELAVCLVLADMDPENLQNLIMVASVLVASSASLYYGLKVNHFPPQVLNLLSRELLVYHVNLHSASIIAKYNLQFQLI